MQIENLQDNGGWMYAVRLTGDIDATNKRMIEKLGVSASDAICQTDSHQLIHQSVMRIHQMSELKIV